jgi:hypothetical protein
MGFAEHPAQMGAGGFPGNPELLRDFFHTEIPSLPDLECDPG